MSLNLHHLRVFAAVVDHGGFSRAGVALRLSQPAVSRAVHELEREVGIVLLDRSGRAPQLTEAGRGLHARAQELFGVEHAAELELRELRGLERGALNVGASTTIATYLLPELLGSFHDANPAVVLRVVSANTRSIARLLLARRIDVALVEGPITHPRLQARAWREDELVVIAPPDHPLALRRRVSVAALSKERFLVRERGSGTRDAGERALAERGVHLSRAMQLGSTGAITRGVAAGLGLAIVSRAAAADQLELGRIATVRLSDMKIHRTLAELSLRGRPVSATARAFELLLRIPGS